MNSTEKVSFVECLAMLRKVNTALWDCDIAKLPQDEREAVLALVKLCGKVNGAFGGVR